MKTIHVDINNEPKEIVNVQTVMEDINDNNINHSTPIATRLVDL